MICARGKDLTGGLLRNDATRATDSSEEMASHTTRSFGVSKAAHDSLARPDLHPSVAMTMNRISPSLLPLVSFLYVTSGLAVT